MSKYGRLCLTVPLKSLVSSSSAGISSAGISSAGASSGVLEASGILEASGGAPRGTSGGASSWLAGEPRSGAS